MNLMKKLRFLSLVAYFLFFVSLSNTFAQKGKVTLEDIWLNYEYYPESPNEFRWMKNDQYYSELEPGIGIARFGVEEGKKIDQILTFGDLDLSGLPTRGISTYEFSHDEQMILLKGAVEPIYRHSSKEYCFVVDKSDGSTFLVHGGKKVSNATFSPDGKKMGFVFENNLFYVDLTTKKETQVTFDGKRNEIINGATDWVYEEEFAFEHGFAWSPNSQRLAYYRFDESEVPEFNMPLYGGLYPKNYTFKYPKAGEANSVVSIHVFDLESGKTVMADLGPEKDQYIARIRWTENADELAALRLNRLQNQLDLLIIQASSGESSILIQEKSDTYIREATDDMWHFLEKSGDLIWMNERSGFYHIYRYGRDGKLKSTITEGAFEVGEILGVDEENDRIYYTSTEVSPKERHLYVSNLKGKKKKRLSKEEGYHAFTVSSKFNYFVDSYSTASQPEITELKNSKGESLKTLVDNKELADKLDNLDIKDVEYYDFTTSDGVQLNGYMIKPPDFDPNKKYPVLMFVYGGPGDQKVLNLWGQERPFNYMWYQMLAQNGYIISCVDPRGTGGRGNAFKTATYPQLGKYETIDMIESAKYLQSLPYVEGSRIGIWGWSYGAFVTSLCMTKGDGLFKAGIAVAPVTNWRFYDTVYTERYLKTPQLNPTGYDENSPLNFAAGLKGAFLLVHGTGDDNVHAQNSFEMVTALVDANKQFDMFMYPNKNHGIFGGYTRFHLYKKMTDFIYENL